MQELESAHVGWHCLQIKNVEGLAALLGKKDNADKTRLLRQVVRMLKKEGLLKKQEGEVMIAKSAVELRCWNMRWGLSGKSLVLCMPLALAKMNDVIDLSIWFCLPFGGGASCSRSTNWTRRVLERIGIVAPGFGSVILFFFPVI